MAVAAGVAAASACGTPRGVVLSPSPGQVRGEFSVEIERAGGTWVTVSQPAYVAVFRVRSGAGAVVLWPYWGEQRRLDVGRTAIPRWTIDEERYYADRAYLAFGEGRVTKRQFLLVVASAHPLPLRRYTDDPLLLEEELGEAYYDEEGLVRGILDRMIVDRAAAGWGWACLGEGRAERVGTAPARAGARRSWDRQQRLRDERECPARDRRG